ncbi:FxLD family lanthipeptide [Saccharopolyspora sp. ASAGF58]|uniref:FxLD family lanthipeptide n=1 Tax=Saccharopolyspora TaxID=1835 RepID=UPI00143FCB59|nr:FxLD family lanthipeptide [Saccharopolyspora sp. ASAGF58]QIZ34211.1 FxLD family lantipeptide [Saccharopolyspora sp. ASAGF58]
MTAILGPQQAIGDTSEDVFDLDLQVETEQVRPQEAACQTDDGCGHTCEISACLSQR